MEIIFVLIKTARPKEGTDMYNISTFGYTSMHNLSETDQL
jgi:hypothetical protein